MLCGVCGVVCGVWCTGEDPVDGRSFGGVEGVRSFLLSLQRRGQPPPVRKLHHSRAAYAIVSVKTNQSVRGNRSMTPFNQ